MPAFLLILLLIPWLPAQADDLHVTSGAASGYVADKVCKDCHVNHWETYQSVGMAQSFKKPANALLIEKFGEVFFHEPSGRYYQVSREEDDELLFTRYQLDQEGRKINQLEIPIDWILGSGNRTRSYLYQTDLGEMFQLPIGWYSEGQYWEMSPGYESGDHDGISRKITRQCLFCHNAFPEVEQDHYSAADLFPEDLPEGTGCQRCHGPGAEHVNVALSAGDLEAIRGAITNPARLEPALRDSVCMQCHLLPAISVVGPVKFDRGEFSFRPGQLLSDYLVHLDIREQGVEESERFEINHHGYRLMKSECYQKSEGALTCISCHNPHVKPESAAFRQKIAGVCSNCHEKPEHNTPVASGDCVSCHMPTRRTKDVVHVTMTDHWIASGPFDHEAITEPVSAKTHAISSVELLPFGNPPGTIEGQAYKTAGIMRSGRSLQQAAGSMEKVLRQMEFEDFAPYLDYAQAQLQLGNFPSAESSARGLTNADPTLYVAWDILGIAQMAQGKDQRAKVAFRKSLALQPNPETHYNLATLYFNLGQLTLAEQELKDALALRPYMWNAYSLQGQIELERNNREKARLALKEALRFNPGDPRTTNLLVKLLIEMGDSGSANNYLFLRRGAPQSNGP